jgi:PHP family Zn ribbon phosphoesterase
MCGCLRELVSDDGLTDYNRMFFSKQCRAQDKKNKLRDDRARIKAQHRCPKCGQTIKKIPASGL